MLPAVRFFLCTLVISVLFGESQAGTDKDARMLFPKGQNACLVSERDGFAQGLDKPTHVYLSNLMSDAGNRESLPQENSVLIKQDKENPYPVLDLFVRLNGNALPFYQTLVCSDRETANTFFCGVECDGGGLDIKRTADAAVLSFNTASSVVIEGGCGGEGGVETRFIKNDDLRGGRLNMTAVDPQQCLAIANEARPDFASDPVPLRQRIVDGNVTCLKRQYTDEEMATVPKQQVTGVAVKILTVPDRGKGDDQDQTSFNMSYQFTLRNGKTLQGKDTCYASDFDFGCGEHFRLRRRDETSLRLLPGNYSNEDGSAAPMNGVTFGKHDQIFKLFMSSDAACQLN